MGAVEPIQQFAKRVGSASIGLAAASARAPSRVAAPGGHAAAQAGSAAPTLLDLGEVLRDASASTARQAALLQTVPMLKRAIDLILGNPGAAGSCKQVAQQIGTTPRTLQRQALAHLGVTVSNFIRDARLTAAHHSLCTARDSRSVAQIASEYGFASGGSFTRTYARRYGETPTQTRARAVRSQV